MAAAGRQGNPSGALPRDLSAAVAPPCQFKQRGLRDALSECEVSRLLNAVDRSSAIGRRDYAVLLLAARYSLRPCDLRRPRLDAITWRERVLSIIQASVDGSNPAICGHLKSGHFRRPETGVEYLLHGVLCGQGGPDPGAPAAGPALEHVCVMQEPVEQRGDRGGVPEELSPLVDRPVGGEHRGGPLVAAHDQFEQVLGGGVGQLAHAEVVDDEQVRAGQLGEVVLAGLGERCLGEFFEEGVRFAVEDAVALLDGGAPDGLGKMTFPGTGLADQEDVLALGDETGGGELKDERFPQVVACRQPPQNNAGGSSGRRVNDVEERNPGRVA